MKYRAIFVGMLVSIIFVFSSNAQQDDFLVLRGPYLGQKPPGMTPEVFAPGIISTADLYICYKKENGTWSKAINIGKVLDTKAGSTLPYISPDGKYLFYNSISDTGKNSDIFWIDTKIIEDLKPKELKQRRKTMKHKGAWI